MENLLSANPDINVVYTINEPMAVGAAAAIEAAALDHEVVVVSIDGSCSGVPGCQGRPDRRHRHAVPLEDGAARPCEAIMSFVADRREALRGSSIPAPR